MADFIQILDIGLKLLGIKTMLSLALPKRKAKKRQPLITLVQEIPIQSNVLHLPPGYFVCPSPQVIFANGLKVTNLKIGNQHSVIEWRGEVDLSSIRDYCLKDIIDLGKDYVEVYRHSTKSPPRGTHLNRFCIATLFKVVDTKDSKFCYQRYVSNLRTRCRKSGLDLISFDMSTGEAKVGIEHFTKYCFAVDASEESDIITNGLLDSDFDDLELKSQKDSEQPSFSPIRIFGNVDIAPTIAPMTFRDPMEIQLSSPGVTHQPINKLRIDDSLIKEIRVHNSKLFQYPLGEDSPATWGIVFGGNQFRYQLQAQQSGYSIRVFDTPSNSREQIQTAKLLLGCAIDSPFSDISRLLTSTTLHSKCKHIISLYNLLFNQQNKIVLSNGGYVQHSKTRHLEDSLKQWLREQMKTEPILTTSGNFKLLCQGRMSDLIRKYCQEGRLDIAQVISKLEDKQFLSIKTLGLTDLPIEFQTILTQQYLTVLENESWLTKLALNVFYGQSPDINKRISEVLNATSIKSLNQHYIYRLFKLYVFVKQQGTGSYGIVDKFCNLEQEMVNWILSNWLAKDQAYRGGQTKYALLRHRQLKNAMATMKSQQVKIKMVNYDNSLSQSQKTTLLVQILSRGSSMDPNQHGTAHDITSRAIGLLNDNQELEAIRHLSSYPLTKHTLYTRRLIENQAPAILSETSREIREQFANECLPQLRSNPRLSFYLNQLELEGGNKLLTKQNLTQLIAFISTGNDPHITKAANRLIISRVLQNPEYFGRVFKQSASIKNYVESISKDHKKTHQKILALRLPQLIAI